MAAKNDEIKLFIPDGLPVEPVGPDWLTSSWPMNGLESSISSIIATIGIFLGLAVAAFIFAYICKTFLPRFLNTLGKVGFLLVGVGCIAAAGLSTMAWSNPDNISDKAMGVQVAKTVDYMRIHGVSADNRGAWDLVCFYYDDKNKNCTNNSHPTVRYKGQVEKVRLEKLKDDSVILYKYADMLPLIEEK